MNIGVIGMGKMGSAICDGIISDNNMTHSLCVYDSDSSKLSSYTDPNITIASDLHQLLKSSRIVLLCIKPQQISELLESIKDFPNLYDLIFVSIIAGISTSYIKSVLGECVPCIRVMPNLCARISSGMSAIIPNPGISDDDYHFVVSIFESIGHVEIVEESLFDDVVALNGSSPAYFFYVVKAMEDYALEHGFSKDAARKLIIRTMEGSAKILLENDNTEQLIKDVCSPGGTTLAALSVFDKYHVDKIINQAMDRCSERSSELSR